MNEPVKLSSLISQNPIHPQVISVKGKTFKILSPAKGWILFFVLLLSYYSVVSVIDSARWVETPWIYLNVTIAAYIGAIASKIKFQPVLIICCCFILALIGAILSSASLIPEISIVEKVKEVFYRLEYWYDIASGEGMSTDLLPYSFLLIFLTWVMAIVGSWFTFKYGNIWIPILISGLALLTSLSFLPERFGPRFYIFAFLCIILLGQMTAINSMSKWKQSGVSYDAQFGWKVFRSSIGLGILVLLIAALIPLQVHVSRPVADLWKTARSPIASMEDEMTRLLGNIPSRKLDHGRFFGKFLPFIGSISFRGDSVLQTKSDYQGYWLSRTYSIYSSQGWISGESQKKEIDAYSQLVINDSLKDVESVPQEIWMDFPSNRYVIGGLPEMTSEHVELSVLKPRIFTVDLINDNTDEKLPADVKKFADEIRNYYNEESSRFLSTGKFRLKEYVEDNMPINLKLINIDNSSVTPEYIIFQRKQPPTPEIVEWKFTRDIPANKTIKMISRVSLATDDTLRNATTEYEAFITDHYLQLPKDFPDAVRKLANDLTMSHITPMDKAIAIEKYLRSAEFIYSQNIDPPPPDKDGVEYFLFETKTGYSDYFASAMATMLRSVGIPTRLAAGYSGGSFNKTTNVSSILDSDSHGWVQVYFPNYGWIDFEPTPQWDRPTRNMRDLDSSPFVRSGNLTNGSMSNLDMLEELLEDTETYSSIDSLPNERQSEIFSIKYFQYILLILSIISIPIILFLIFWNLSLKGLSKSEEVFTKCCWLGHISGVRKPRGQTAQKYINSIGKRFPEISDDTSILATAHTASTYGINNEDFTASESWKRVRKTLVTKSLTRIFSWALKSD